MFGIPDPAIWIGYLLTILSLIACIVYGALNWYNGSEPTVDELKKDFEWEQKDEEINEII
jgi:hypothetical protein